MSQKGRSIESLATLIDYSMGRWYGFNRLSHDEREALEGRLNDLSVKLALHTANASFGPGAADNLREIANIVQKLVELSKFKPDAVRPHLWGAGHIDVEGHVITVQGWLDATAQVFTSIRRLSDVVRDRPLSGGERELEPQTLLAGDWLRSLYRETYPGRPFEVAAKRTQTNSPDTSIPLRWGPGPLFIALATKGLTGQHYGNGEAIRKARRNVLSMRGREQAN